MTDLATWLGENGLQAYNSALMDEGFDLDTLRSVGLSDEDMTAIGITKIGHRRKFASALAKLNGKIQPDTSKLVAACSAYIPDCLSPDTCWKMLDLCFGNEVLSSLVWKYITTNAAQVIYSLEFSNIPQEHMVSFLQSSHVKVDEFSLLQALATYAQKNPRCDIEELAIHIRFGLLSKKQLLAAEKIPWVTPEMLFYAWRQLAAPEASLTKFRYPDNYFKSREKETLQVAAEHHSYEVKLSSTYPGMENVTYESLTNDEYNLPGAATNYEANAWISVTYPCRVLARKLILGCPSEGTFASQGWASPAYISNLKLQTSEDGNEWVTVFTTPNHVDGFQMKGPSEFEFEPQQSKYWRLTRENYYIATGVFILKYY